MSAESADERLKKKEQRWVKQFFERKAAAEADGTGDAASTAADAARLEKEAERQAKKDEKERERLEKERCNHAHARTCT
jgi:hypothetical protein